LKNPRSWGFRRHFWAFSDILRPLFDDLKAKSAKKPEKMVIFGQIGNTVEISTGNKIFGEKKIFLHSTIKNLGLKSISTPDLVRIHLVLI